MLILGSALLIFIGLVHSYLGEKYILIRLFRRDNLPKLMGSDWFTKGTLRFAWHLTTIAWWGFAAILFVLAEHTQDSKIYSLMIISVVFLASGFMSLLFSRGKHLSWLFFFIISAICYLASYA